MRHRQPAAPAVADSRFRWLNTQLTHRPCDPADEDALSSVRFSDSMEGYP